MSLAKKALNLVSTERELAKRSREPSSTNSNMMATMDIKIRVMTPATEALPAPSTTTASVMVAKIIEVTAMTDMASSREEAASTRLFSTNRSEESNQRLVAVKADTVVKMASAVLLVMARRPILVV